MHVLYEDNHCLVVDKPAGLLVQADRTGDVTLVDRVREDLRRRHQRPGNVFVVAVHRLDRPVSGVLLLARTSKAASRLTAQFRDGRIEKTYWAIVERAPQPAAAALEHWLVKEGAHNRVRVVPQSTPGARRARLHYRTCGPHRDGTWLEVELETGRAHQIRVQLAAIGCPIAGDLRYGAARGFGERIALHARRLVFDHPTRSERIAVEAPPPPAWGPMPDRAP
jgi:23S rRNA pseudouridine1911/1915/1917 synthase